LTLPFIIGYFGLNTKSVGPQRSAARFILDRTHAFADPNEADSGGIHLVLPTPAILADASQI
jgi:hypothetical protein